MKKCYATIHVWLHDMDLNIDLNYRRKIRPISDKMTTSDKDTLVIKRGLIKTHLDTQKAYITIFWASEALYIIGFKNIFDVFLINLKSSICFFAFQDQSLTKWPYIGHSTQLVIQKRPHLDTREAYLTYLMVIWVQLEYIFQL